MQLVLVSGLSGSGKSIALDVLEDSGYYCVDNLPATLLLDVVKFLDGGGQGRIAVSVDARSVALSSLPQNLAALKAMGAETTVLFLEASPETLLRRFSETRRSHPLAVGGRTLSEAIARERELLAGVSELGHRIDTTGVQPKTLRNWIKELLGPGAGSVTLLFESFAFRDGIPLDADWVVDARMLPNPYYQPGLALLTGRDTAVIEYLEREEKVRDFLEDLRAFLARWLPEVRRDNRNYLSVAIGCTGGRHRSVFLAERLAQSFGADWRVLVRHRSLADAAAGKAGVKDLPLFPLGTVLFPGGLLPLRVFEQRYLEMAKACLRDSAPFGVCLIREGAEVGAPATPEPVGCLARIMQWDMQQLGVLQIQALGAERFRILERRLQADGLLRADVELLPAEADAPLPERLGACRRLLERVAAEHGEHLFSGPYRFDSCAWVGARLAEILPLPGAMKQQLLEMDALPRLETLQRLIAQQA